MPEGDLTTVQALHEACHATAAEVLSLAAAGDLSGAERHLLGDFTAVADRLMSALVEFSVRR